ncbi:Pentatricopeptide repeat-containing protein At4g21705, mitochondrial [Linum perenne]
MAPLPLPASFFKILNSTKIFPASLVSIRSLRVGATRAGSELFSRISPLGDPATSLAPLLDQWVEEGKQIKYFDLQRIVRQLRSCKRYSQALEVSEWILQKGLGTFRMSDRAVQLDLIGRVRGLESAETYFTNLDDREKVDKLHGSLLNCFVREGLVAKSVSQWENMKELGFAFSTINYNDMMTLYIKTGMPEKVPGLLSEMKENGISPDCVSYRICMNAYAATSQLDNVEKMLKEMEEQPHITMDWLTYASVASIYIKAGSEDAALNYLKRCETKLNDDTNGFNHLISLYATLGNKDEVLRLWSVAKVKCRKLFNRGYVTVLGSLVKLGDFEAAGKLLEEWHSSCEFYDFRVPNTLLIGYCQKGLVEKAEIMLRDMIGGGRAAIPNSWAIIAAGYVEKQNMEKAFDAMTEALAVHENNKGWRPKPQLISSVLRWAGENADVDKVETFVSRLQSKIPKAVEMYNALLKVNMRNGKEVDWILQSMKADEIDADEETNEILNLKSAI